MAQRLEFEIDVELEAGRLTGHAGVPGLIEAFRQTGTAAVIEREVRLKQRQRGLSASEMVESLLAPRGPQGPRRCADGSSAPRSMGGRRRAGRGSRPVPPGQGTGAPARP